MFCRNATSDILRCNSDVDLVYGPLFYISNTTKPSKYESSELKANKEESWDVATKETNFSTAYNALWKTTDEFWKKTTISGLSNARKSNSGFRRSVWMLMLAVFVGLTITGLSNVIDDFKSYPITTSVTVEHRNQVYTFFINFNTSHLYILTFALVTEKKNTI